jgi:hypothetical protein
MFARRRYHLNMRRGAAVGLVVAATVMTCVGCGFRERPVDGPDGGGGGGCGDPGATLVCTSTTSRGFEPLGRATAESSDATLAPAGDKIAAVWEEGGADKVHWALIDYLGAVKSPKQLVTGQDPVLLRVDDQLVLFWRLGAELKMQSVDDAGVLLGQAKTVVSGTDDAFAAAWNGSEYGLVLAGANGDMYNLYRLRVGRDGSVLGGPEKLADGGINSLQPNLVWTGCEWAAAWTDTRPGTPAVYFARFDASFARLGPDQMLSKSGMRGSFPSLAAQYNGGTVVCYQQLISGSNHDIFCTRLDPAGNVTNTAQLTKTASPSQSPHVIAHGKNTWVLWDDYLLSANEPNVEWQFLDETGAPIGMHKNDPQLSNGWRAHGLVTSDALYYIKFYGDPQTTAFTAHAVTLNCF